MRLHLIICLLWSYNLPLTDSCAATSPPNRPAEPTTTIAPNLCGTMCRELTVRQEGDSAQQVTQTPVENAGNGCRGFQEVCRGVSNDAAVILTWYDEAGMDVGSTFGTGMASAILSCASDNRLMFNGTKIAQVECFSA